MAPPGLAPPIPIINTLSRCGDFSKTVGPYLHQLQELPNKLLAAGLEQDALLRVYLETNPVVTALAFALALVPVYFIFSEVTRNHSQVDRSWSILPTIYIAHYFAWAYLSNLPSRRVGNVLAISTIWSVRLTFNYARKGGYSWGSEDYRWPIVKNYVHPIVFLLFSAIFIALAQHILLFLVTTPTYVLLLSTAIKGDEMDLADTLFTRSMLAFIMLAFVADQQQWNFHKAKAQYQKTAKVPDGYVAEDLDRGFLVRGLWTFSRHPNFAAEQAFWLALYQWSCWVTDSTYNWTAIGAGLYLTLFQASTWLTELLSQRKYPDYRLYRERVGKFLPKLSAITTGGQPVPDSEPLPDQKADNSAMPVPAAKKGAKAATRRKA